MTKDVGLWIDHKQAVIVITLDQQEEIKRIASNVDKHVRYSGGGSESHAGGTEDGHDNHLNEELKRYYDEVITSLHDATSILIIGPGEAKVELRTRLQDMNLGDRIIAIETADRMTDHQIAAEIRHHFRALHHGSMGTTQQDHLK
jgi:hypothetical protein